MRYMKSEDNEMTLKFESKQNRRVNFNGKMNHQGNQF